MKPKKNPRADVRKQSLMFFQIGLILMLFGAWQVVEWKDRNDAQASIDLNIEDDDFIDIPITDRTPPPPPPPPPPAPDVIEVVEDKEEVEEAIIESTESNQTDEIAEIEEIEEAEVEEIAEVPFILIENVPVYPGCESAGSNDDRKTCMEAKIRKFIRKKFNTDLASDLGLEGRQVIRAVFKIDQHGQVTGVQARAPHDKLADEAVRVLGDLPKMTPGKQRGKPVIVSYSQQITFDVQD